MTDPHRNVGLIERLLGAMTSGDVETIGQLQADDFTLTVAGHSTISGVFTGAEAAEQYRRSMELTAGQMQLSPQHVVADDQVGAAFLLATARRPDGREIEQRLVHEFRFADGKVASIHEWIWDQDADKTFWS